MAVSSNFLLISASLLFFIVSPSIQTSVRPKALVLPVVRDDSTLQYVTEIKQRTPLVPIKLTLDLGGGSVWVDCENDYVSSSYKPVHCKSRTCKLAFKSTCGDCVESSPPKPGCNNRTCNLFPTNNVKETSTIGEVALDVVSVQSTNGNNPGKFVSVPKFPFTCGWSFLVDGLANGVKGVAGLGRTKISMPSLFSSAFKFPRKFAICLSSFEGVVFFGDGPYNFLPSNIDITKYLIYTPLVFNPISVVPSSFKGESSSEYFIGVKGIKINEKPVPLNETLLSISKRTGHGGTKISTVTPNTVMETSIYRAVVKAFINQIPKVARARAVAPFGACLHDENFVGPIPRIDLVLQNKVVWSIVGSNSMVQVNEKVSCLGFVDGGLNPRTSIVIGGGQIEDNFLQIDLEASRIGFSSNLLFQQTSCSFFNFTSTAVKD